MCQSGCRARRPAGRLKCPAPCSLSHLAGSRRWAARVCLRCTMSDVNPFDSVEPHRHLPERLRSALWRACEVVLSHSGEFVEAAAWLEAEYSEAACRAKCEAEWRDERAGLIMGVTEGSPCYRRL